MTTVQNAMRSLLIYGLALPAALILGYMLATPTDLSSFMVLLFVLLLLALPLLLKWHHPLLFLAWNTSVLVFFLPGSPPFWLVMAFIGLGIAAFERALLKEMKWIAEPSIVAPVLFILAVVFITGKLTGGFGLRAFGSQTIGARGYFYIFAAAAGFFAMTAHRIPPQKGLLYAALFLLGSVPDAVSSLVPYVRPDFYFIFWFFPADAMMSEQRGFQEVLSRFSGWSGAAMGVYCFLLARYGIKGLVGWGKFHRLLLVALMVVVVAGSGFRSLIVFAALIFLALFYFEGLFRTKYLPFLLGGAVLSLAFLVPFASKLPLSIQRSISFLPVEISPIARYDAQASADWRIRMWEVLVPEVPKYLWLGKGLGMAGTQFMLTTQLVAQGRAASGEVSIESGNYHNGPLTVLIPFGIWGAIGFLWFLTASFRALYLNYRSGEESLGKINAFLLAYFATKIMVFFLVFGNFYTDFPFFTGVLGLSLALNGGICRRRQAVVLERVLIKPREILNPAPAFSR